MSGGMIEVFIRRMAPLRVAKQVLLGGGLSALRLFVVFALAIAPASAQHKVPTEAQCREMVNSMLQTMRTVPVERESDRLRAREIAERAEKVVRDNRARGASECDSWGQITNIVTRQ